MLTFGHGLFFVWGGLQPLGTRELREYLDEVRQAAHDAQRARDALLAAEDSLTRIPRATTDGTHVALGCVNTDRTLKRVESYESTRARQGARLHECLHTLRAFRSALSSSQLNSRACDAMWLRYAHCKSFEAVADELEVSAATAWRIVRDAEVILAESLGVTDAASDRYTHRTPKPNL